MALPEEPLPPRREPARREIDIDPVARDVEPVVRDVAPVRVSVRWPGVWTGFLIAMGIFIILAALGAAVGATSVSDTGNTQAVAKGAAWWAGISFLIALFIGGAVSARWVTGGLTSVLQGALVWVLAVGAFIALASFGITLGANGLFASLSSGMVNNAALQQMAGAMNQMGQSGQVGTTGTVQAAQSVAPAAWVTFIVLIVSAIAAILGAVAGRQKYVRPIV